MKYFLSDGLLKNFRISRISGPIRCRRRVIRPWFTFAPKLTSRPLCLRKSDPIAANAKKSVISGAIWNRHSPLSIFFPIDQSIKFPFVARDKLRVKFDLKTSTGPVVPTVVPLDLKNMPSLLFSACLTNRFFWPSPRRSSEWILNLTRSLSSKLLFKSPLIFWNLD